jgi:hypothetical protein
MEVGMAMPPLLDPAPLENHYCILLLWRWATGDYWLPMGCIPHPQDHDGIFLNQFEHSGAGMVCDTVSETDRTLLPELVSAHQQQLSLGKKNSQTLPIVLIMVSECRKHPSSWHPNPATTRGHWSKGAPDELFWQITLPPSVEIQY